MRCQRGQRLVYLLDVGAVATVGRQRHMRLLAQNRGDVGRQAAAGAEFDEDAVTSSWSRRIVSQTGADASLRAAWPASDAANPHAAPPTCRSRPARSPRA